jgi:hypothetical protein
MQRMRSFVDGQWTFVRVRLFPFHCLNPSLQIALSTPHSNSDPGSMHYFKSITIQDIATISISLPFIVAILTVLPHPVSSHDFWR